jgi:son of sevenless-like protein
MPSPATKKKRMRMNKGDLLRMDPGIIAQHLTLLESKLYMRIKSQECLNWAKVQTGRTVTNLYAFSSTHDKLAKWVKLSVLSNDGLGKRADTVDFWIKVAEV